MNYEGATGYRMFLAPVHVCILILISKYMMQSKTLKQGLTPKGILLLSALSVSSQPLASMDDTDGPVDDALASIEILCSKAMRGQQCCDRILTCYRISKVLTKYSLF